MKTFTWRTHKIVQETKDAISIYFDTKQSDFNYQPGQYLNVRCRINGELVSRSYSFSTHPNDPFPAITIKRVVNGVMSNFLFDKAHEITEWDIEAPFGNFIFNKQNYQDTEVVFLAGGSGISPLMSMLKSIEEKTKSPLLLYGNRTKEDIIFHEELMQMQANGRVETFFAMSGGTSVESHTNYIEGRFSPAIIQTLIQQQLLNFSNAYYFICGPQSLIETYKQALLGLKISTNQIHTEYFDPLPVNVNLNLSNSEIREVLVNYYETRVGSRGSVTYECTALVEVNPGRTLLEACQLHGIKVPSACKKGTCGSCFATRLDGEVKMQNNYALTDEEVAEGKILLCQSFPQDQSVSIAIS